ncbi:NAD-dependent epimerase/dehydratase family protein [Desulfitobacterium hafniense]|uniref:NAD-dependent epimerase/dehydratase family protein n=1 Tax=Desulfitobacterium hafniense TaxID=49338 RepID=UPI0003644946|nr:NAD(P)-dependent oxidoreductase [Desulfitobacterium hafniense]
MSNVLVTGAGGYIGRHVVNTLLDKGYQVSAIDLNLSGVDERAKKLKTDIFSDDRQIYDKLGRPDVLIHMAWKDGFVHNSSSHIDYLPKHYSFLKNMLEGGLPQFSIMGTMHEVGYWEGEIDENTPTNPLSLYGIAKNSLRQICSILISDYPNTIFQWLRAYYIYGDDMRNHSIFAKIASMEKEGKQTFPFNSGRNQYDFIDVKMLAKQVAAAATQKRVQGIINCCSGIPIPLKDKVEEFIQANNFSIRPEYGVFPDRPYDSPGVWGNAEKIRKIMKEF